MKVCILVLTYKRNPQLFRVLSQVAQNRASYSGGNQYSVWVADSDMLNPETANIEAKCDRRIVNPGVGFDGNILNYFKSYSHEFDFTLTISDDDLFSSGQVNPFSVLDLALESRKSIVLFNHYDCHLSDSENVEILGRYYNDSALAHGDSYLKERFLQLLPQHVGIMYSKESIQRCLVQLARFQDTHHLYVVPFLLEAIDENVLFFDYPLFLYSIDHTNGGAWESHVKVFEGLLKFLVELRTLVPEYEYQIAKEGFLSNYLGADAWLRRDIEKQGLQLPTNQVVMSLLAGECMDDSHSELGHHLGEMPLATGALFSKSLPIKSVYPGFVESISFNLKCLLKPILKRLFRASAGS